MTEATYSVMNRVLEECGDDDAVSQALNAAIATLDPSQESDLVDRLSERALARAGRLHWRLRMRPRAREHLLWGAYSRRCTAGRGPISDALLGELIADYDRYHFAGLESVAILCLKHDALTEAQARRIAASFPGKAVTKQVLRFRTRRHIAQGDVLGEGDACDLLAAEAYDLLVQALERGAIAAEALHLFQRPSRGERHRKDKLRLYQMARQLADQSGEADLAD